MVPGKGRVQGRRREPLGLEDRRQKQSPDKKVSPCEADIKII